MNPIYVVTDVEVDGPVPGENSMLSFASVAVNSRGQLVDEFEAVLSLLEDAVSDPGTMAWFRSIPEALAAATENPQPPGEVMHRYVAWIRSLSGDPIFAAHPLAMDGSWTTISSASRVFGCSKARGQVRDCSLPEAFACDRTLRAYCGDHCGPAIPRTIPPSCLVDIDILTGRSMMQADMPTFSRICSSRANLQKQP